MEQGKIMIRVLVIGLMAGLGVATAAPSITAFKGVTKGAVIVKNGNGPACVVTLRDGSSTGDIHPDYNGVTDTSTSDFYITSSGDRVISFKKLGIGDWYLSVTGCGTLNTVVTVIPPPNGSMNALPFEQDLSTWNKSNSPQIDYSANGRGKWYFDPTTGYRMKPILQPLDFTFADKTDGDFTFVGGGVGWTNVQNITLGSTANANTSTTNPVYLFVYGFLQWQDNGVTFENVGLIPWGNCGTGTGDDCIVDMDIVYNPNDPSPGNTISFTLPSVAPGTLGKVTGGSTHQYANGAFPVEYPDPYFAGWGNVKIPRDRQPTYQAGTPTIVNGLITIPSPTATNNFPRTTTPGMPVWVQNSGAACSSWGVDNICTVASVSNAGQLQLVENIGSIGNGVRVLPWAIRLRKRNAAGNTIFLGVKKRYSGSYTGTTGTANMNCSPFERTDGNGVKGRPCFVPEGGASWAMLYFISNDGEVVTPISGLQAPPGFGAFRGQQPRWSPTVPDRFYATNGSNAQLYQLDYTGNWSTSRWLTDKRFAIANGGAYTYFDEDIDWTNAIGAVSVNTQITNNFPFFNSPPFSAWTSSVQFVGVSGKTAFFLKALGNQDNGPCHIAAFNLETQTVYAMFNSLDHGGAMVWGNCHGANATSVAPNSFAASLNDLLVNDATKVNGGPYRMPIEAVRVSGVYQTNKGLPWPNDGSYDATCPTSVPQEFQDRGATGTNCVFFLTTGNPCTIKPAPGDITLYGQCAWNVAYGAAPTLKPGMYFVNADPDGEHFRVLEVTSAGGNKLYVTAQRNAVMDYCCRPEGNPANPGAGKCIDSPAQFTHAAGMTVTMMPGRYATCTSSTLFVTLDPDSPTPNSPASQIQYELSRTYQGHSTLGKGVNQPWMYLSADNIKQTATDGLNMSTFATQPPVPGRTLVYPTINGTNGAIASGQVQQYMGVGYGYLGHDANSLNPNSGSGGNLLGNTIGNRGSLTFITGNIWRISSVNTVTATLYKTLGIDGWSGSRLLADASGTADISTRPDYVFCYAYKAGDCRADSLAGYIYIKAPLIYPNGTNCATGVDYAEVPCVRLKTPGGGYIRQFRTDRIDSQGTGNRLIASGLRVPGAHYPYYGAANHGGGEIMLASNGGFLDGVKQTNWIYKIPPYRSQASAIDTLASAKIKVGSQVGMTHARVAFGRTPLLRCSGRDSTCYTDSVLAPYAYEDDTKTGTACSSGCEITLPVSRGYLTFIRIDRSFDGGTTYVPGDITPVTP